ncbi:MAG: cell division protein ZapE [Pseudomonadota bacterium]
MTPDPEQAWKPDPKQPAGGPVQRYEEHIARRGFTRDPAQEEAINALQQLWVTLNKPAERLGWLDRLRGAAPEAPRGLYLWGGVGRGKTYLMDIFHQSLERPDRRRVHFHRFMDEVHHRLKTFAQTRNPLEKVAGELLEEASVLCFDEFFVQDIADAMILSGLLKAMFDGGLVLVATSNIPPRDLYRDGLQRAKFLPAIDLLERHTRVLNVDGDTDYRLRILKRADVYHYPNDRDARAHLEESLARLATSRFVRGHVLVLNQRELTTIAAAPGVVWCSFDELCVKARSTADYIELSRRCNTVLLSDVPQMDNTQNDPARRFINLVDELYDRNVNLIISAAVPAARLYTGKRLEFEFRRTVSRLTEMGSHEYLAREHKP